uniref:Uncharacterized protein n=1 Tax=Anabas testudineus TaxID=64144 RepID=A0A7N6AC14_ANATE
MSGGATRREKKEQVKVQDRKLQKQDIVFLQWGALSHQQIEDLLQRSAEELQWELKEILGFKNYQTCMREAALLDYNVCGFWWAKEASFTPAQTSFTMAVLHMLLENIRVCFRNIDSTNFISAHQEMSYCWAWRGPSRCSPVKMHSPHWRKASPLTFFLTSRKIKRSVTISSFKRRLLLQTRMTGIQFCQIPNASHISNSVKNNV